MTRRKRLIEVAFPLEEVSAHSRREKNVRHGHISTLHIWWARRPLAACRAFIYEPLIDDPEDDREREELLKEVADLASWDAVRRPEQVVRTKEQGGSGLSGAELLARARRRILDCNDGKPPRLLDPFAGGGSIPLEALRLGCEVEASDLNPVAVLILKGTVEYPQKYGRPLAEQRVALAAGQRPAEWGVAGVNGEVPAYIRRAASSEQRATRGGRAASSEGRATRGEPSGEGGAPLSLAGEGQGEGETQAPARAQAARTRARTASFLAEADAVAAYERNPLAADVRYWGSWMLERARQELGQFYPPDADGSVPVAYLWSRTVPCPNCGAEMPLIRQYWLARKEKKKVALKPVLDRVNNRVDFAVVEGADVTGDPAEATTSLGDVVCLSCHQVAKGAEIRDLAKLGKMGATMTCAVLEAQRTGGKRYRPDRDADRLAFDAAAASLREMAREEAGGMPLVPDEPMPTRAQITGGVVTSFGLDEYGKLFNQRQLLALATLSRLIADAYGQIRRLGLGEEYAAAVATYLGLAVDRQADRSSTLCRWDSSPKMEAISNTFGRQAMPMVWDYAEGIPFSESSGGFESGLSWILLFLSAESDSAHRPSEVGLSDVRTSIPGSQVVVTDPPYYDAIDYAGLSDFFYVWLKRSLGFLYPDLLTLPLTPKREQLVVGTLPTDLAERAEVRKTAIRRRYVEGMADAFAAMRSSTEFDGSVGVVFAHTAPDAWATLLDGLLSARLIPQASWPIDTELENKVAGQGQARLKTSVWMSCRPRDADAGEAFLGDVLSEMRPVIRERLLYFWSKGIRGADFFISAIGPALSVFGRHRLVLRPDGSEVSVRDFLDIVRRESTQVALEQVLQGADLGTIDQLTRQYVTWVWSYSRAPLEAGEAIALCLATGATYGELVRLHSIAVEAREKSKKLARLRTVRERGTGDEALGEDNPARPAPLIDQLQRAAYDWSLNKTADLAAYRARLGEARWQALRTLGQAVAECLPDGDEDRRLINGLLSSSVMGRDLSGSAGARHTTGSGRAGRETQAPAGAPLPGLELG